MGTLEPLPTELLLTLPLLELADFDLCPATGFDAELLFCFVFDEEFGDCNDFVLTLAFTALALVSFLVTGDERETLLFLAALTDGATATGTGGAGRLS